MELDIYTLPKQWKALCPITKVRVGHTLQLCEWIQILTGARQRESEEVTGRTGTSFIHVQEADWIWQPALLKVNPVGALVCTETGSTGEIIGRRFVLVQNRDVGRITSDVVLRELQEEIINEEEQPPYSADTHSELHEEWLPITGPGHINKVTSGKGSWSKRKKNQTSPVLSIRAPLPKEHCTTIS